jgi:hypothetical protein
VGKADNKNPQGQYPNGSDHNNGYECDGNHGIGKTNPAHTGCTSPATSSPSSPPTSSSSPPNTSASAAGQAAAGKPGVPGSMPGTVGAVSSTATRNSATTPSTGTPPLERSPQFASLRTPTTRSGSLPFTGIDTGAVILLGCMLIGLGMMGLGLARLRAAGQR